MSACVAWMPRVSMNDVTEMPIAEPMLRASDCIDVASPRSDGGSVV